MADLARAAFARGPLTVSVAGADFTFPYMSAGVWLDMMTDPDWVIRVLRSMTPDTYERLMGQLETGRFGRDDLVRVVRAALAEAGGRDWWELERLISALNTADGRTLGAIMAGGADPDRMSLAAFCAVIWRTLTKGAEQTDLMRLETEMSVPPAEAVAAGDVSDEIDLQATVQQLRNMPGVRVG